MQIIFAVIFEIFNQWGTNGCGRPGLIEIKTTDFNIA